MVKADVVDPTCNDTRIVEAIDLGELVAGLATAMTRVIGAHTRVDVDIPPWLPEVYGVREELEQLVLDLVANASDAMRPSGGNIGFVLYPTAVEVAVEVTDEGPKLDPRVFGYTLSGMPRLGLAGVRAIAARHGAEVRVASGPGLGTTVRVALPAIGRS